MLVGDQYFGKKQDESKGHWRAEEKIQFHNALWEDRKMENVEEKSGDMGYTAI